MAKLLNTLGALALTLSAGCESDKAEVQTERDVAVTDFTLHECKRAAATGELATGRETEDYAGLECVAWRFSDKGTAIDLINRLEGCGFDGNDPKESLWTPKLVQTGSNALTYSVSWEFEGASACGSCLHDFSIAAKAVSLDDADLSLELATRPCNDDDCKWSGASLKIPETELKEGIRCRYIDWARNALHDVSKGKLGGPPDDGKCDDGLKAVELSGSSPQCLRACDDDGACPTPLTKCKEGACQLADPW